LHESGHYTGRRAGLRVAPQCACSPHLYHRRDFAAQVEAQQCFDSCWVATGEDVHGLDADWDYVACEHLPSDRLPMHRKVVCEGLTVWHDIFNPNGVSGVPAVGG
jgi:hypothetical protein